MKGETLFFRFQPYVALPIPSVAVIKFIRPERQKPRRGEVCWIGLGSMAFDGVWFTPLHACQINRLEDSLELQQLILTLSEARRRTLAIAFVIGPGSEDCSESHLRKLLRDVYSTQVLANALTTISKIFLIQHREFIRQKNSQIPIHDKHLMQLFQADLEDWERGERIFF